MPRRSSTLLSAKMLRTSSSTTSTFLPTRSSSERCSRSSICLLLGRQVGDHAVQEERGLVEQPLGRLDALDHDAARERVQPRVLLGRELLAGEDDDRQVAAASRRRGCARAPRSPTCRAAAGRAPRSRTRALAQRVERLRARSPTVTISTSSWPSSSVMLDLLGRVVLDHEQPPAARRRRTP